MKMNSMERTLTSLGHKEPDRVPLFLFPTMHGARELGLSIEEYYSRPEYVVEGQLRLAEKYRGDCLSAFCCASMETEAWGGTTRYLPDGPPQCGPPIIGHFKDIDSLQPPEVRDGAGLGRMLDATRLLKAHVADTVPIVGVVISPFSLPIMQMGFDSYLELIHEQPERFNQLMDVNTAFCVEWANAQLEAGATAICYFDPMSSSSIIPRELYLKTGRQVAGRVLPQIKGPTATHLASGRCLPVLDDIRDTGTAAIGVSCLEDLAGLKAAAKGRISLVGNLNGVEMHRWTRQQAEDEVKKAIAAAGRGGGFILSDNHGEIPFQVSEEVLLAIGDAVARWGRYPLDWLDAPEDTGGAEP